MGIITNCHTHIFTNDIVPVRFLPFGLVQKLGKYRFSRRFGRFLKNIRPRKDNDFFDRVASFINIGAFQSQEEIFELLKGFYPEESRFVVLSMDMEFMGAGAVPNDLRTQLEELADLKKKYPEQIFPFVCVDPRREGIADLVKEHIEEKGFQGIKLYPPLGYYPFDARLDPVFEFTQAKKIPVMAHCSRGGVYFRGMITKDMLTHPITGEKFRKRPNKHFSDHFIDPANYAYVLEKFPELKLCFAHFGGGSEWDKYLETSWEESQEKSWFSVILDLMKKHPHVYADTSFTLHDPELHPLLKVILKDPKIRQRVLYGSDFYMVELMRYERSFSVNLRGYLGEEDYFQIAETNPAAFLGDVP